MYTRGDRSKGIIDPDFAELYKVDFSTPSTTYKKKVKSTSRPSSPKKASALSSFVQALTLLPPLVINFTQPIMAHPQLVPWGAAIGPLALGNQLHDLPIGSRKHLPKFSGDGKVTAEDHISAFFTACAILRV